MTDWQILTCAINEGLGLITWTQDAFAYADSFDEKEGRYRGLRTGQFSILSGSDATGLIVKPDVARRQMEAESHESQVAGTHGGQIAGGSPQISGKSEGQPETPVTQPVSIQPKRFHGTVTLDATRVGRDASRIADEVIAHLSSLIGATVTVTLEVEAYIPPGAPDHVVRTVTKNCRTLKFTAQGFEKE